MASLPPISWPQASQPHCLLEASLNQSLLSCMLHKSKQHTQPQKGEGWSIQGKATVKVSEPLLLGPAHLGEDTTKDKRPSTATRLKTTCQARG